jgi:hypothetical protein
VRKSNKEGKKKELSKKEGPMQDFDQLYRQIIALITNSRSTMTQKEQARNMATIFHSTNDSSSLLKMRNRLLVGCAVPRNSCGVPSVSAPIFNDNFNPRNQMPMTPMKPYKLYQNFGGVNR